MKNLKRVTPTVVQNNQGRQRLQKLKKSIKKMQNENTNKILKQHLRDTDDLYKAVDSVKIRRRVIQNEKLKKRRQE